MLYLDQDFNIFYKDTLFMKLKKENNKYKGTLVSPKIELKKEAFSNFFKKNLAEFSKTIEIVKEDFSEQEIKTLENIGFYFSGLDYDYEKDIMEKSYIYIEKEEKFISKEAMKDIIEKLDL